MPESAWSNVGELTPAVRWRPMYHDDYFDAGRDVNRAIRLRVVEPWIKENQDIEATTKGKPTEPDWAGWSRAALGDDSPCNAIPAADQHAGIAAGKWERHVEVAEPSWPTFDPQGRLLLVSQKCVVRLNLADGKTKPVLPERRWETRDSPLTGKATSTSPTADRKS